MSSSAPGPRSSVTIRIARPEDAEACGPICYRAFYTINTNHNFTPDIPSPERATGLLKMLFAHPRFYCVLAEVDGRIVGSNCLDERSSIAGVGPITVDPDAQNAGAGRMLMRAVMDRARDRGSAGIRLVQAAFHNRSLSLYTKLGFDPREPLSCMNGPALHKQIPGCSVRPAVTADLDDCDRVCQLVHGHERHWELVDAINEGSATVVERGGRITGYATGLAFFSHAVTESLPDLQALIGAAESFGGPGMLVPTRNARLLRWCLENGLRVTQPMTLMSTGLYNEPAGAWLPSITF